jgi:hypothetical protein
VNKQQQQVEQFHLAFDLPAPATPAWTAKDVAFRLKLITEELAEGFEALHALGHEDDPIPVIDLLCDLKYFIDGTAVAMGIDLEPFFDAIHDANMRKQHQCAECGGGGYPVERVGMGDRRCQTCMGTGKVSVYREDGKVQKPPMWVEQDLYAVWKERYGDR